MLVHQGKGKKRFQKTVKSLIEWISKEADGNRKLALIKGNIVSFYEEKRIIVLHVKDIDIKYRKHGYNAETKLPKKAVKPELSLPKIEKEPLRPVKTEIKLLEQKQQLDIHTDEFLLQFIDNQQLQNMKQMDVPPIPLKQWFSAEDTSTYTLVPIDKFMGVENSRRREGKWLNQLYRLDRSTQNLQRIQIDGIEKFKNLVLRESDITFNYYEDLDVYYVDDGGTHRSVIAKILNIDYVMAKIWVYKSNGKLEKEQQLFRKHLYQLENSIREMGFVPTYDSAKQSISICSNDNQLVTILENLVYPTFYQEGKDTFPYWISMFRELKVEGEKLNTKPHFLRKWILYYKKKKNAYLHEEYYYQMLRMYTLTNK
ncbi:hypothetical protein BC30102_0753 [Bacillus cereus]|nr:hypothetical protein BC30102_0753 [Bacillus cereus]